MPNLGNGYSVTMFCCLPLLLLLLGWVNQGQAGTQTMDKQLLSPAAAQTGEEIEYQLSVACSGLTGDCGALTIEDPLPAEVDYLTCQAPVGLTCNYNAGTHRVTVTKALFEGGDSFLITLRTRIRYNVAAGATINNTAESTITTPNGSVSSTAPSVTVQAGNRQWQVRKQRIDPAPPLLPAVDTSIRYRVQLCALTGIGNLSLTDAVLVDNYPAGAALESLDGGVNDALAHTITWNIPDADVNIAALYAGQNPNSVQCVSRYVTLSYPSGSFAVGDNIANDADGTDTLGPLNENIDTDTDQVGAPTPGASLSKSAPDTIPGDNLVWTLRMHNRNSNVPLDDFIVVDALPSAPAYDVTSITSGRWPSDFGYAVEADVQYSTAGAGGPWTSLTGAGTPHDGAATLTWSSPGDFPVNITHVRWVFSNTGAGPPDQTPRGFSFTTSPVITQPVPPGTATDGSANPTNCLTASFDGGGAGPNCDTPNIEVPSPSINMSKSRLTANNVPPGSEVRYRLRFQHNSGDSTGDVADPVVADLLPTELEYISWDSYNGPGGQPHPNLEIIDDYNGSGRTLLRFSWQNPAPAGSIQIDGSPGVANPATFTPLDSRVDITVTLKITPGTPAGTYSNQASFFDNAGGPLDCSNGEADGNDLDGDGDVVETRCSGARGVTVINAAVFDGSKWVKGDPGLAIIDDPSSAPATPDALCPVDVDGYTRFPCVAQTQPDTDFAYRIRITNAGNLSLTDYVMYDVLPKIGDTGVGEPLAVFSRDSRWLPSLTGAITPNDAYTASVGAIVEYSTAANPCRPEVSNDLTEAPVDHWQPGCSNDWGPLPADPSWVTAYRIYVPFVVAPNWEPAREMVFDVPMHAPADVPPSIPGDAAVFSPSWNSFAHRATETAGGTRLNTAEPRKVGIVVPPKYRLGNLVWLDVDNDGSAEQGEPGIGSVTVQLWHDTDSSGDASDSDTLIDTMATDAFGKYAFSGLDAGNYYVVIPNGQGVLAGYSSSSNGEEALPNADGDNNDNGVVENLNVAGGPIGNASNLVSLGPGGGEPTNEQMRSDQATDDDNDLFPDAVSNYSVDFGYHNPAAAPFNPVSIGSTVFLDPNNNGHQDAGESGIAGVTVEMYSAGPNGLVGGGDDVLVGTSATDAAGDYFFPGLPPGRYYVRIPVPPAAAPISSTPTSISDDQIDGDDNGVQPGGSGTEVLSPVIDLSDNVEPVGEGFQGGNQDALDDDNGDMTVDFGFLTGAALAASQVSIGSTVFYDLDNNGLQDMGTDNGIPGVRVQLFRPGADGLVGTADDILIAQTTTSGAGNYFFGALPEGDYFVKIPTPPSGWALSSGPTATTDNQVDGDDNGIQNGGVGRPVVSPLITLSADGEPAVEGAQGGAQDAGDDNNGDMTVDFGFIRGSATPTGIPTLSDLGLFILVLMLLLMVHRSGMLTRRA